MNDDTRRYLEEVLALDPLEHPGGVVALRASHRARRHAAGVTAELGAAGRGRLRKRVQEAPSRESLEAALDAWSESLFERDEADVHEALGSLALESHPDLDRVRRRLATVNSLRGELDALEAERGVDRQLVAALRDVLVRRGAEAATRREDAVRRHGKGKAAASAKRFARLVTRRYPAVAALEAEWLGRLESAKRDAKDSLAVRGGLGFLGAYFLISALVKLVGFVVGQLQGE